MDKGRAWRNRIFFVLWLTYASFYLGRVNLSVALPGLMEQGDWTRAQVGLISTAFFWMYALGQLVNGLLGDRMSARAMVTVGLAASAGANLLFGTGSGLPLLIALWAVNGYVQALGWGPIVKTLAHWFPAQIRGIMGGRLGTAYILGGAASVTLAGFVIVRWGLRAVFWVPAVLLLGSAVHWYARARNRPEDVGLPPVEEVIGARPSLSNGRVWAMGAGLFCVNIVRYGFLVWAPTYLFEVQGARIDHAAYSSVVFPIAGALGALAAGWASDRWFGSRRSPVAALCLLGVAVLIATYRWLVPPDAWMLGLFNLAAIGFLVFGAHVLMVVSAPMDYGSKKRAASAAGLIDCLGYVGAGLEGVGTGWLVDMWGWGAGFAFWLIAALAGASIMGGLWWRKQ